VIDERRTLQHKDRYPQYQWMIFIALPYLQSSDFRDQLEKEEEEEEDSVTLAASQRGRQCRVKKRNKYRAGLPGRLIMPKLFLKMETM